MEENRNHEDGTLKIRSSHLAEADQELLARLKLAFGKGHNLGDYEQDYTSTEHYGDHFIRVVEAMVGRDDGPGAPSPQLQEDKP